MSCSRARRAISEAGEDRRSVARHLRGCAECSAVARDGAGLGELYRTLGPAPGTESLRQGLADAVTGRILASRPPASQRVPWLRPALAGAAAALAAVVGLVAVQPACVENPSTVLSAGREAPAADLDSRDSDPLRLVRDGGAVRLVFNGPGDEPRMVKQSTDPRFGRAKVTRVSGGEWTDSSPAMLVGGVIYYRVD